MFRIVHWHKDEIGIVCYVNPDGSKKAWKGRVSYTPNPNNITCMDCKKVWDQLSDEDKHKYLLEMKLVKV